MHFDANRMVEGYEKSFGGNAEKKWTIQIAIDVKGKY